MTALSRLTLLSATIAFYVGPSELGFAQSNQPPNLPNQFSGTTKVRENDKNEHLTPGECAAWATAIASVLNIGLVGWLFILADRSHRRDRREDFRDRETERKARVAGFWIEELIMRPNHGLLTKFFDESEERLKNAQIPHSPEDHGLWLARVSKEIEFFKADYHKVHHRVVLPLQWVHSDFSDLLPILGQIEDLVTGELSKVPGIAKSEALTQQIKQTPQDHFADLRREFFQTIHKVQTKAVSGKGASPC
jgi:hypothetical protein